MKRSPSAALAATLAALTMAGMTTASPAYADDSFARSLRNTGNDKCLQPLNASMDAGVPIVQEPCDGSRAQEWGFMTLGGTTFRMLNHETGLCVDAQGNNTNGTPIIQWPCATISNETFDSGVELPGEVTMTARVSGTHSHCIDVPGQGTDDGLAVQLWSCNGTVAQAWQVFSR